MPPGVCAPARDIAREAGRDGVLSAPPYELAAEGVIGREIALELVGEKLLKKLLGESIVVEGLRPTVLGSATGLSSSILVELFHLSFIVDFWVDPLTLGADDGE